MENKIPKTSETFDDIDHPESRWVTYRGERIGPPVDHISQFSCCVAIRATPKSHMLFFEYWPHGIWVIYFLSERYQVGLC